MVVKAAVQVAGHFGEWMQGRLGSEGPVVLITVPCPDLHVSATWQAADTLHLDQTDPPLLSNSKVRTLLTALGYPATGHFTLTATMKPGRGAGASTAALVALARARGSTDPARIASACLSAEGASDPVMMEHPGRCLWAPRQAQILEHLPNAPAVEIVGGFLGDGEPTDPTDNDFPDIADLIEVWRSAAATRDMAAFARCASLSAERTTRLRGPRGDPTAALAQATGAIGHLRAHTGSARGLIFRTGEAPDHAEQVLAEAGFLDTLRFRTGAEA